MDILLRLRQLKPLRLRGLQCLNSLDENRGLGLISDGFSTAWNLLRLGQQVGNTNDALYLASSGVSRETVTQSSTRHGLV